MEAPVTLSIALPWASACSISSFFEALIVSIAVRIERSLQVAPICFVRTTASSKVVVPTRAPKMDEVGAFLPGGASVKTGSSSGGSSQAGMSLRLAAALGTAGTEPDVRSDVPD